MRAQLVSVEEELFQQLGSGGGVEEAQYWWSTEQVDKLVSMKKEVSCQTLHINVARVELELINCPVFLSYNVCLLSTRTALERASHQH